MNGRNALHHNGKRCGGALRYRSYHEFDTAGLQCRIAGEVKGFDVAQYMQPKEARRLDTFIHYGVAASAEALKDSGLEVSDANRERIGCVIGSGIGGLPMIENNHTELMNRGPRRVSPFLIPGSISNMIAGTVSIQYGLQGPNLAIVTACTTGLHSIGDAGRMIEHDDADVMRQGGSDRRFAARHRRVDSMKALRANDDPTTATGPSTAIEADSDEERARGYGAREYESERRGAHLLRMIGSV